VVSETIVIDFAFKVAEKAHSAHVFELRFIIQFTWHFPTAWTVQGANA